MCFSTTRAARSFRSRFILLDGREFEARIKNFDRFALIVEHGGMDHLIFKHAIATIRTPRSVPNYFSSHHP